MIEITNPAFDYDQFGQDYSGHRQTDPRIAQHIHQELEGAHTVLNVGAGGGSYEPERKHIVAVEPSVEMRKQRLANGKVPAINAKAGSLPFDDNSFDASMALVTVHHWPDMAAGLKEMRRVTRGKVLVMTFDPDALDEFWNVHYFPELIEVERKRYPTIQFVKNALGGKVQVNKIPIPFDCVDGFQEAFYARPEAFLQPAVRQSQSAWGFLPDGLEDELVKRLGDDLTSGEWDRKFGEHRTMDTFVGALRVVIGD